MVRSGLPSWWSSLFPSLEHKSGTPSWQIPGTGTHQKYSKKNTVPSPALRSQQGNLGKTNTNHYPHIKNTTKPTQCNRQTLKILCSQTRTYVCATAGTVTVGIGTTHQRRRECKALRASKIRNGTAAWRPLWIGEFALLRTSLLDLFLSWKISW